MPVLAFFEKFVTGFEKVQTVELEKKAVDEFNIGGVFVSEKFVKKLDGSRSLPVARQGDDFSFGL